MTPVNWLASAVLEFEPLSRGFVAASTASLSRF
jgi:hypothetical protein